MRWRHGGRRARIRGQVNAVAYFAMLACAVNLARLSVRFLPCGSVKLYVDAGLLA
jgi:hypothetical protein